MLLFFLFYDISLIMTCINKIIKSHLISKITFLDIYIYLFYYFHYEEHFVNPDPSYIDIHLYQYLDLKLGFMCGSVLTLFCCFKSLFFAQVGYDTIDSIHM